MLNSAKIRMPAVDYVSMVKSVYKDREALVLGAVAGAIAASLCYLNTGSSLFLGVIAAILGVGVLRYLNARAFWNEELGATDTKRAKYWENRAMVGAVAVVLVYGAWCFISIVVVADPFSETASISLIIAMMVGVVARNFGLDRLVTLQTSIVSVILGATMALSGDLFQMALASLLLMMMVSFRNLAAEARGVFLNAVHGRVEATRLANELDMAVSTMPHGLCMIDDHGLIAVINEQTTSTFFGATDTDFNGKPVETLIASAVAHDAITPATAEHLMSELKSGGPSEFVIALGDGRHCEVTVASSAGHSVIVLEDITERVRTNARISHMARYDGLTDLPNRSYFTDRVKSKIGHSGATQMMMMVDLDDFKHVNDTLGHPVGDKVLVEVAKRLKTVLGTDALISRFGSDEFMVFRENVNEDVAGEDARAVLAALRVPVRHARDEVRVAASVGVVLTSDGEIDIDTLLTRADLALYDAKAAGKGRWSLFHEQMDVEYRRRQRLKADMLPALEAGDLFLHYQPIIQLKSRKIIGCEALVRWKHPEFGLIPPMQFIPIAEEMGLISEISRFVLNTAVKECAGWPAPLNVSVNVSATDFRMISVEDMVSEALEESGLEPSRLIVEITETALIEESAKVSRALAELRRLGVGMALDDFGTGYSSLSYLRAMAFTKIKIDRSFIVDIESNRRSQRLLSNIARMSHDLEMTVTVEGIETEEQLKMVEDLAEIEHAQGYLFGAPLPSKDIDVLINRVGGTAGAGSEAASRKVAR